MVPTMRDSLDCDLEGSPPIGVSNSTLCRFTGHSPQMAIFLDTERCLYPSFRLEANHHYTQEALLWRFHTLSFDGAHPEQTRIQRTSETKISDAPFRAALGSP